MSLFSILSSPGVTAVTQAAGTIAKPSVFGQILNGLNAGTGVVVGYYNNQAAINQAKANADAAKYGTVQNQLTGYGQMSAANITAYMPYLIMAGALLGLAALTKKS